MVSIPRSRWMSVEKCSKYQQVLFCLVWLKNTHISVHTPETQIIFTYRISLFISVLLNPDQTSDKYDSELIKGSSFFVFYTIIYQWHLTWLMRLVWGEKRPSQSIQYVCLDTVQFYLCSFYLSGSREVKDWLCWIFSRSYNKTGSQNYVVSFCFVSVDCNSISALCYPVFLGVITSINPYFSRDWPHLYMKKRQRAYFSTKNITTKNWWFKPQLSDWQSNCVPTWPLRQSCFKVTVVKAA